MIEDRHSVGEAYCASFERLGMALQSFARADFEEWFGTISANDMASVEGYLVGQTDSTISLIETIRLRTEQPVIAVVDSIRTDMLVRYYSVGVDDVVRKPVHAREISCRINAVQRRISRSAEPKINPEIHIFSDGQNPIVGGYPLELP
ncbi:MAG: DNA-binding response regulator, partial [Hyphomicrobiales bacterium]|nr:DNA-binding response regulator [Hyphomicrobiales bacterium]